MQALACVVVSPLLSGEVGRGFLKSPLLSGEAGRGFLFRNNISNLQTQPKCCGYISKPKGCGYRVESNWFVFRSRRLQPATVCAEVQKSRSKKSKHTVEIPHSFSFFRTIALPRFRATSYNIPHGSDKTNFVHPKGGL